MTGKPFQLITIPISHYCEKVRWALDHVGASYTEHPHMPPFHRGATKRHGGTSVPVLMTDSGALTASDAIIRELDRRYPGQLYPGGIDRTSADKLHSLFDTVLGVHTRRWAYSHVLTRPLLRDAWTRGVPTWQRWLYPVVFGKLKERIGSLMQISPTSAADSHAEVLRVFDDVGSQLADGRAYLMGPRFSVVDIAFGALAAPILMPPEHHIPPWSLDTLPPQMQAEIHTARATTAGAFGLRLYRDHRAQRPT
jgi:glutathione S-transferase